MKKYIAAITAAALTLCTFTACSDKGSGSSSDIQSSAVSQEETQADPAPKVPDVPFDEETAKKTAAEAINGFFDSINSFNYRRKSILWMCCSSFVSDICQRSNHRRIRYL